MEETYDYAVVGGGSSGCIVAALLAERGHSVLLIEAGASAEAHPETLRTFGYKEAFINDALMHDRFTTAQAACGGRRLFCGTGRGMGGSGSINAMVYTRGGRDDYESFGPGWRWDDVEPAFRAVEERLTLSKHPGGTFTEACLAAAEIAGFRRKEDLNDGDMRGVLGYEAMNFSGNDRRSSYASFIRGRSLPSLRIETESSATRLAFSADRRAVGVHYQTRGTERFARVRAEVIVTAGALATPALLLRSGIGPSADLRREAIPVVVDQPGVGQNLHDHPNVTVFFAGRTPTDSQAPQLYGFHRMADGSGPSDSCFVFYPAESSFKEGLMRMVPAMFLPPKLYADGRAIRAIRGGIRGLFAPALTRRAIRHLWGIVIILGKPKSRGELRLGAGGSIVIDPSYLSNPADLESLVRGVNKARELAAAEPLAPYRSAEVIPGGGGSANATADFVRSNLMTTYHFAGTCRMGDDPRAVVDRELRVNGVTGLRIADASIVPETPVSAMNAPSMMIGYRAARFITAR